jgi:endonuclease YncB( thermonuclease family)
MNFFQCCRTNNNDIVNEEKLSRENSFFVNDSFSKTQKNIMDEELEKANWYNTDPYVPNINYGRIIKVYDGDSVTLVGRSHEKGEIYRYTLRLSGINAPELRTKDANEKQAAIMVRDVLKEKILNKYVYLSDISLDKYGRILCTIQCEGKCINSWLIFKKYVVPYDGGKKNNPENWLEYIASGPKSI